MNIGRVVAIVLFFLALAVSSRLPPVARLVVLVLALGGFAWYARSLKQAHGAAAQAVPPKPQRIAQQPAAAAPAAGAKAAAAPVQAAGPAEPPATASLLRVIEEKRKTDPLIGAKLGAQEISHRLLTAMKNDKGVHIESLLCALGALAGYACQASLRAQAVQKGLPETAAFTVVEAKNGDRYFFGDPLNKPLAEAQFSVWGLAAGAAQKAGCSALPDLKALFGRVAETVGSDSFGVPQLPEGHRPGDLPLNYLRILWPPLLPIVKRFCPAPQEWPVLFGLSIQDAIDKGKSVIAPDLALRIVMESAIPMSKIDLAWPAPAKAGAASA
jgi:hypothetical protein